MGTSLRASLATHHSIYHYVASLLALKFHSSHREQIASLIAKSSLFSCLRKKRWAFAHLLGGLCPRACSPAVELGIPIPSDQLIAQCRDSCSPSKVPYHCHLQGEPYKTPFHKKSDTKIPISKKPH